MKKLCLVFTLLFVWSAQAIPARSFEDQIKSALTVDRYELPNGLVVLLHEDHSSPMVSVQQWFRVGARHEKPGRTGLAHFFEHLMFKGTKRFSGDAYKTMIHANGGSINAFTTKDYTGYYTNILSDKLELILDIESDRMRNLILDENNIQSEREVVKEERRMRYENSVQGSLYLLLNRTVHKTSNYRWPTIGYMRDLNAAKLEEFKEFYDTYYSPNNCVLVIAGDFKISQAKKWIQKYYGKLPRKVLPKEKFVPEAKQKAQRTAQLKKDVQNITLSIAYMAPANGHIDSYALDIAAAVLGGGTSSRLYKRLVRGTQQASSVDVDSYGSAKSGTFDVTVSIRPGKSDDRTKQVINQELRKIRTKNITDRELKRVKNEVMLSYLGGLKTIAGKAQWLALQEVQRGDYRVIFADLDKYNAVTADDVRRVAKTYLKGSKQSVVRVVPKK